VPCPLRHRSILSPAGHSAKDKSGIASEAHIRAESETLAHAGPEPLDHRIGLIDQTEGGLESIWILEVDRH